MKATSMPARFTSIRLAGRQFPSARMIKLTCLWTPYYHAPLSKYQRNLATQVGLTWD